MFLSLSATTVHWHPLPEKHKRAGLQFLCSINSWVELIPIALHRALQSTEAFGSGQKG